MPKGKVSMKKRGARKGSPKGESKRSSGGSAAILRSGSTRSKRASLGVGLSRTAGSTSRVMTSAIPANIGASMPRSFFGFGGRAQILTDQDPDASLRIQGRDLFYAPIEAGSTTAAAGFGGTASYYAAISPKEISDRLENIEEVFNFYAIRGLRIFYAPATGSTSTVQVALGYTPNPLGMLASIPTPTQTQVLEMASAAIFPAWQPAVIEFKFLGTKLFYTTSSSASIPVSDVTQGYLACTLLNGVASTVYGQLWMEYIVDFYSPTPILTDPARLHAVDPAGRVVTSKSRSFKRVTLAPLRGSIPERPMLEGKSIPPPAGTPSENGDGDGWVDPSPPAFRPAPSSAPGTPGYTPRVAVPAKRAQ